MEHQTWKKFVDESKKISNDVKEHISTALLDLENEFRELLGVNPKSELVEMR